MAVPFKPKDRKQLAPHERALLAPPGQPAAVEVRDRLGPMKAFMGDTPEVRSAYVSDSMRKKGLRIAGIDDGLGRTVGAVSQEMQKFVVRVKSCDIETQDTFRVEGLREKHGVSDVVFDTTSAAPFSMYPGKVFCLSGHQKTHGQSSIRGVKVANPTPLPTTCQASRMEGIDADQPSAKRARQASEAEEKGDEVKPFSFCIAAGPFTSYVSNTVECIKRVVDFALRKGGIGAVIIVGPLSKDRGPLSASNAVGALEEDAALAYLPEELVRAFPGRVLPKIIVVPSTGDVFHEVVYPQPAYSFDAEGGPVMAVTNPGRFFINGVDIAVTSLDVLRCIRMESITHSTAVPTPSEDPKAVKPAVRAALEELLAAGSMYPILPPQQGVPLDVSVAESHLDFGASTPDVLLLPSMQPFADAIVLDPEQPEDRVAVINPGYFSSHSGGAQIATVTVSRTNAEEPVWKSVTVDWLSLDQK